MEAQTKEIPEIEDSNPHLNSCSKCKHVAVCGAYRAFSEVLNELEQKYVFVKRPFPSESLAVTCKEFSPISLSGKRAELTEGLGI